MTGMSYRTAGDRQHLDRDHLVCRGRHLRLLRVLDHEILLGILAEKIHDNRFLRLIRNMLKAGYLEDWEYHDTLSGVPQGGVVSPILSNIYLHKLDEFVEQELIPQYTRGALRAANPAYRQVDALLRRARRRGDRAEARRLALEMRTLPSTDPMDPGYRRLRYMRYADDHLLGFTGPKAEAEQIKARLAWFLRETLGLELNAAKTLITHARSQRARFLGYDIIVQHSSTKISNGPQVGQREDRAAGASGRGQGPVRPLPETRQAVAPAPAPEPGRLRHRAGLRSRISGRRELLPARPGRLAAAHAALARRDVDAQDAGCAMRRTAISPAETGRDERRLSLDLMPNRNPKG